MTDTNLSSLPVHLRLQVFRSQSEELAALEAREIVPGSVLLTYWEAYPFGRGLSSGWQLCFYGTGSADDYFFPMEQPELNSAILGGVQGWIIDQLNEDAA